MGGRDGVDGGLRVGVGGQVVINELMASGDADWVELLNEGSAPAALSGWCLSDRPRPSAPAAGPEPALREHPQQHRKS